MFETGSLILTKHTRLPQVILTGFRIYGKQIELFFFTNVRCSFAAKQMSDVRLIHKMCAAK